jgi:hypothetical protein
MKTKSVSVLLATLFVAIGIMAFALVPTVHAYGAGNWQVAVSSNCDNPSICGSLGLGGFWAWVEVGGGVTSGNSGDATATGCGHLQGGGGLAGADHFNVDITGWATGPGSAGSNTLFLTSGSITFTGHTGGSPVTVPITSPVDTGIQLMPGHFSTVDFFGFTAPGVSFQLQVVQL